MLVNKLSDERRCCQRINTHLSADVVNRTGESMQATVTGLSASGLTLEGDSDFVKHIEVIDTSTGEPYFPVEASVFFTLPLDNSLSRFDVRCRQVHKRRLSQNSFNIGMVIFEISEELREQLAHYVGDIGKA